MSQRDSVTLTVGLPEAGEVLEFLKSKGYSAVRGEQPTPSALEMLEKLRDEWRRKGDLECDHDDTCCHGPCAEELTLVLDQLRR